MKANFKGIIFDMDGTLTVPVINFENMRNKLGVKKGTDLLEYSKSLPNKEKKKFFDVIESFERQSLLNLKFQSGVKSALEKFKDAEIKLGLVTRNNKKHTEYVLNKLDIKFNPVITREFDFVKPDPEPIKHILSEWSLTTDKILMVGDFRDDIISGNEAGITTCFFKNKNKVSYAELADFSVESYIELEKIILK
ncbi:MAG: HAD-IA family hydrolase [Victivallales bacterium]|nr:HAD-IA family hydrolase [Victivallales bacterium]MCF7888678.1 HAD-IA family hydrolase [Victivallales bacterium]